MKKNNTFINKITLKNFLKIFAPLAGDLDFDVSVPAAPGFHKNMKGQLDSPKSGFVH